MHGQIFRVTVYKTRKRMCEGVWVDGDSACVREFCKRARARVYVFVCVCVGGGAYSGTSDSGDGGARGLLSIFNLNI
jgi:hypothetical protein